MPSAGSRFSLPYVTPVNGVGAPYPGGQLFFYLTSSSTPANTYANSALTIPNTNPVVANGAGLFPTIFLDPAITYKVVLEDQNNVQIWTADPVSGPSSVAIVSSLTLNGGLLTLSTPIEVASASTIDLGVQTSNLIGFTGTINIQNFGLNAEPGYVGWIKIDGGPFVFIEELNAGGAGNIKVRANGRNNLIVQNGDFIFVEKEDTTFFSINAYWPGSLFVFSDARPDLGAGNVNWTFGADNTTAFPDFGVLQGDSITRLVSKQHDMKSVGNETQLSMACAGGSASAPTSLSGATINAALYNYFPWVTFTNTGLNNSSYANFWAGRQQFIQLETPGGGAGANVGGGIVFGASRTNNATNDMRAPEVMQIVGGSASGVGGGSVVLLGRASYEDSGHYRDNFAYAGNVPRINNFNVAGAWPFDVSPKDANLILAASDMNSVAYPAMEFRLASDSTSGWDIGYDSTKGLTFYTVAASSRIGRFSIDTGGDLVPVTTTNISLGSSSFRWQQVFAQNLDLLRAADATVLKVRSSATSPTQDLVEFNFDNAVSATTNVLQVSVNGSPVFKIKADGSTQGSGGFTTPVAVASLPSASGAGAGARRFVNDSNATLAAGIGNVVAGGGAINAPVYSDGTNWRLG